jgi:general secretion pathway protein F
MPTYEYVALDAGGKEQRGNVAAESASAARRQLRNRRLHASKIRPISEAARAGGIGFGRFFQARRRRDVLEFTRQVATMIEAEVKLTEALGVMISQAKGTAMAQVLQNIRDQVLAGESLADSMKEFPGWFDTIYIAMVRVGEVTGNLGRSFNLLSDYIGKRHRLESKLKSAMIYPMILVILAGVVTTFLMTFVVPKIANIIQQSGRELPTATQILINISHALTAYWWVIVGGVLLIVWLFRRSLATTRGRLAFDKATLKIPLIGELIRQGVVARFATTLAALIRSGMPVADSLQVAADVSGNEVMARAIRTSRERIISGADIATPLQESRVVGPAVAHMIAVGERTGELEKMLLTIAGSIEETTDIRIQRLSSVIEPVIIIVMAVVVGFIMVATLLPILQVTNIDNL